MRIELTLFGSTTNALPISYTFIFQNEESRLLSFVSKTKILPLNYILFRLSWNRPTTFLYEKKIIPFTISHIYIILYQGREGLEPSTLGHEPMRYPFLHLTYHGNET
jgi:hypothetical protein